MVKIRGVVFATPSEDHSRCFRGYRSNSRYPPRISLRPTRARRIVRSRSSWVFQAAPAGMRAGRNKLCAITR